MLKYTEIFSRSYIKKYDPNFFNDKEFAYETMTEWLHEIISYPYVRKAFLKIAFDDELQELEYELKKPIDEESDKEFVKKVFSDGFVICWMRPQIDSIINLSMVVGDKNSKRIQSNYNANKDRLDDLEKKHKKYIRDYGYTNGLR